jgi:metalloendopeptidase OMA1, mitochondrial
MGFTMRRFFVLAISLVLIGLMIVSCYTNPQTGRKELVLFTPAEEAQLGLSAFSDLKKSTPISSDAAQNDLVRRVGGRISQVATLPNAQWEFVVFQDQTANAFCLPGGKVGVYSGILPITSNEVGLATVIGHEVSHAVARHGGERMSHELLIEMGGMGLQLALQKQPQQTIALAMTAYGVGTNLGHTLPHSRAQELEADYMGLLLMAKAGYDPHEAITFWQRFSTYIDQHGGEPPEFLSTHPLDAKRISELQKHLPEALAIYNKR